MVIRPLEPADRDEIAAAFERLSPESRYRRFFAAIPRLSEQQLDYLTQVDQHDHVALFAVDEQTGEGVGVARYVRTGPGVAEPAVVVADDWQGRGVASALLDRLVERALEEGVTSFVAPVLADNTAAIRALERLGDTEVERHGHEVELTIALQRPQPDSGVRDLLRSVAAGTVEPALTLFHRMTPRPGLPREQLRDVIVSSDGEAAAQLAGAIARAAGDHLVLVAALGPLFDDAAGAEARLERAAAPLRVDGTQIRTVVRRGDLGALLLDEAFAERARLIVVEDPGGEQDVSGRLLGGAWNHVSHHAQCDVLVARPRAAAARAAG